MTIINFIIIFVKRLCLFFFYLLTSTKKNVQYLSIY
nr:MAG TPA: hypothetical protein [Caudoviricetes sp.]